MAMPADEPFLSARVLAVRPSTTHKTIKHALERGLGMRAFVRRWIPHRLSEPNKRERVIEATSLLEALRADERNNFANTPEQLMEHLHSIFDRVTFGDLQRVFLDWIDRLAWVIEHEGEYFID
jgi:hypothetical protein